MFGHAEYSGEPKSYCYKKQCSKEQEKSPIAMFRILFNP